MAPDVTDPRLVTRRAPIYALAFEESERAFALQERSHTELRGRAANLMATAAVVTSIFGGPLGGTGRSGMALVVATASFVGVGLCTLGLLCSIS